MDTESHTPGNGSEPSIELRPESPADEGFLFEVYASTRQEELEATGWDSRAQQAFLQMQFRAMRQGYANAFPKAEFALVTYRGHPIGRAVVDRNAQEVRLVDLALLPAHRGRGLGTEFMRRLMSEAASTRKPLRLRVYRDSRALGFYQRLGFNVLTQEGPYTQLEWRSSQAA